MTIFLSLSLAAALAPSPCFAQTRSSSQPATQSTTPPAPSTTVSLSLSGSVAPPPPATPPASKYLVYIYTSPSNRPQRITFKGVQSPVILGSPVPDISASSDSRLPVTITVQSGPAKFLGSKLVVTGEGTVVLEARQPGNSIFAPAASTASFDVTLPSSSSSASSATPQEITWKTPPPPKMKVGDPPLELDAVASSGHPVVFSVSGPGSVSGKFLTVTSDDTKAGPLVLTATQAGVPGLLKPVTENVLITVVPRDDYCSPLLSPLVASSTGIGAKGSSADSSDSSTALLSQAVSFIGSPEPFTFTPLNSTQIAIYSSRYPLRPADNALLISLRTYLDQLLQLPLAPASSSATSQNSNAASSGAADSTKPAFSIDLKIPHSGRFADLAAVFSPLGGTAFTITDGAPGRISITSKSAPSCHDLTKLLTAIRDLSWGPPPQSPVAQLFHVQSSDVAATMTRAGGSQSQKPPSSAPSSPQPSPSGSPNSNSSNSASGGTGSSNSASPNANSSNPAGSQASNASPSSQPSSAGQSQSSSSSAQSSSSSPASPLAGSPASANTGGGTGGPSGSAPVQQTQSAASSPLSPPSPLSPDLLLFDEGATGNDDQIAEKKRILAYLDLSRPEMLINVWSMQTSSEDPDAVGQAKAAINARVEQFNAGIQDSVQSGWAALTAMIKCDGIVWSDPASASEPTDKTKEQACRGEFPRKLLDAIAGSENASPNSAPQTNLQFAPGFFEPAFYNYVAARYIGDTRSVLADLTDPSAVAQAFLEHRDTAPSGKLEALRKQIGACPQNQYCLGYLSLFKPLRPDLTNMLLASISSAQPGKTVQSVMKAMEHFYQADVPSPIVGNTCQETDKNALAMLETAQTKAGHHFTPALYLQCFRDVANNLLVSKNQAPSTPYAQFTRAAVADFLFHYKMANEFPHDFVPYDLNQSAQSLNAALSPFIEAFNNDLVAYQDFLRDKIRNAKDAPEPSEWVGTDKSTFVNDGIITVRTLSAKDTTVSTQTQNFLDATSQPDFATLLSALSTQAASYKSGDFLPEPVQLIQAAIGSIQTSKVQIGRSLSLEVVPRSQPGASAAEIDVTLKADDIADPTYYTQSKGSGNAADLSRVAQHDTQTRVRVDSIKLFEVTSFSAILQRSRSRFPLILPFVEIPYIGSIVGIPIAPAKEYHSSTAFLSAVIVPTATDMANNLRFVADRIGWDENSNLCPASKTDSSSSPVACAVVLHTAQTMSDLNGPVREFHRAMLSCIAEETPYTALASPIDPSRVACKDLTFDSIIHEPN